MADNDRAGRDARPSESVDVVSEYEDMLDLDEPVMSMPKRLIPTQHISLDDFDTVAETTSNVCTCAVVGSLKSGKSSFVRFMAARNAISQGSHNVSAYEMQRNTTLHARPHTLFFKDMCRVVTLIDTSSHADFGDETLIMARRADCVFVIVDALEKLDTADPRVVEVLRSTNTVVIFNKIDMLVTMLTSIELLSRINDVCALLNTQNVFLGSMTDEWVANVDSVRSGTKDACIHTCLVQPIYKIYSTGLTRHRTLKKMLEKLIANKNAVFAAISAPRSEKQAFVFKHYEVDSALLPLVFMSTKVQKNMVMSCNDKAVTVERIFVSFYGVIAEVDSIAPNIPVFVLFSDAVQNLALINCEHGEVADLPNRDASCFKVVLDSAKSIAFDEYLGRVKMMYVMLDVHEYTLFGPGEMFLDSVVFDLRQMSSGIRVVAFDVSFRETCAPCTSLGNTCESGNSFDIACARTTDSSAVQQWCTYNGNVLVSSIDVSDDEREKIVRGFVWAMQRSGKHGEPLLDVRVAIRRAYITDTRGPVVVKDFRNTILNALQGNLVVIEPFLSIRVFCKESVAGAVRAILRSNDAEFALLHSAQGGEVYEGIISCVDSLGLEACLFLNTFGEAFCVKRFVGYRSIAGHDAQSKAERRAERHRRLSRYLLEAA